MQLRLSSVFFPQKHYKHAARFMAVISLEIIWIRKKKDRIFHLSNYLIFLIVEIKET